MVVRELRLPLSERDVRELIMGDMVYVSGTVYTMRDSGYVRTLQLTEEKKELPFNVRNGAVWHAGPIVKKKNTGWEILSVGSTTSSRFTSPGSEVIRKLGVRVIIGKGSMGREAVEAMKMHAASYFATTGGAAAYYAQQIKEVVAVHWLDLGMPAAIWALKVERLGPLLVGIDSHGRSLYEALKKEVDKRMLDIYSDLGIDPARDYVWWPKRIPGLAWTEQNSKSR
jgi:fumarate hydratase subunit beta